jgi:hypothetical protein
MSRSPNVGASARIVTTDFDISELPAGDYLLAAKMNGLGRDGITGECAVRFARPVAALPLTTAADVPEFEVEIAPGGGFTMVLDGHRLPFESSYSLTNGDENRLTAGEPNTGGEAEWQVSVQSPGPDQHTVSAKGKLYSIERTVQVHENRVTVKDTLANTGEVDLGIVLSNSLDTSADPFRERTVAGYPAAEEPHTQTPSSYVAWDNCGVGILPVGDMHTIQPTVFARASRVGVRSETLALPPGDSYTLEWAIYPTSTPD